MSRSISVEKSLCIAGCVLALASILPAGRAAIAASQYSDFGPIRMFRPSPVRTTGRLTSVFTVQPFKFESFNPAAYKGPVGKIKLSYDKADHFLTLNRPGTRSYLMLSSPSQELVAPVGTFRVAGCTIIPTGQRRYSLRCIPKLLQITIAAGATTELKFGESCTAYVDVKNLVRGATSLNLILTDSAGNLCTIRGPEAPGFQIISESGQVLQEGKFRYG